MQVARFKSSSDPQIAVLNSIGPGQLESAKVIAGRYRLTRALGRGGMGTVFLAEDLVLQESRVAIKILSRGGPEDRGSINSFIREVRLTHKIQHENVVRTFDFGQDGDSVFYTMEYLPGESLDVIIRNGGLPCHIVSDLARQLLCGLAAVHRVGVVHRDLKPSNVIVSSDGVLKITDFGIARSSAAPTTMFASDVFGTLRYVAPEVLLGKTATEAVDFYALGVILFELLAGRLPFKEDNPAQLLLAKIEDQAPSIRDLRPDLPAWLIAGVDGLLDRDPILRIKEVNALSSCLDVDSLFISSSVDSLISRVFSGFSPDALSRRIKSNGLSLVHCFIVLLSALFVLPLSHTDTFQRLEAHHADVLFRLRGSVAPNPGVVVVSMDEQSYQRLGVPLTAPWPRAIHAKLLNALADAGAKRVVFDVIFADADRDNQDDRDFAEAMKRVPTVLGAALGVSQRATINGAFLLEELLQPAEMFEAESVGVGVVGLPQSLGRVREFPHAVSQVFPSVNTLSEISVAVDRIENKAVPVGSLINFYGPGRTIPTIPYELVLSNRDNELAGSLFQGKVVFVGLGLRGSTGASQRDAFITPYDQQTFGAELHATAASNLLNHDWIRQPVPVARDMITFGVALIIALILTGLNGVRALVALSGAVITIAALQFSLFISGVLVPSVVGCAWAFVSGLLLRTALIQPTLRLRRRRS
jgi:serine/threonine protein kinase